MNFDDIEHAFMFVSGGSEGEHSAILCRETGEIFYVSEMGDSDALPDDVDDDAKYIQIPHKNELDLGKVLVFDFVSEYLPDDYDEIENIFRRRGAYGRFKQFLDDRGMLDKWYAYENERQKAALQQWCKDNGIEITG